MILSGLCSVTFRQLSPQAIIDLVSQAGLDAIEWGGDVHVPHGDVARAKEVAALCREAGIATPSYGSYYRMDPTAEGPEFSAVLDSAVALEAKTIRIWAGTKSSAVLTADDWKRLSAESHRAASLAAEAGCEIAFEYHLHTATDDNAAADRLVHETNHPAARIYWQPRQKLTVGERLDSLTKVLPHLAHLHVFQWVGDPTAALPLAEGLDAWKQYLALADSVGGERHAFLEFVPNNSKESFLRDAATLRNLLGGG